MSGAGTDLIRTDWSFELASVTQRFALNVVVPEPEALIRAVHDLADSVPAAASQAEQLVLHDRLRIVTDNASHQFHAQFHRYIAARCDHRWRATSGPMDWNDVHVTAEHLLLNWVTAYLASFERSHEWPAPVRAARLIRSTFRSAWDIEQLARRVGCSRTQLIRSFKEAYGLSVGGYHTRCRISSTDRCLPLPPVVGVLWHDVQLGALNSGPRPLIIVNTFWNIV